MSFLEELHKFCLDLLVAVEEYMKKYNGVVKISIGSQPQQIFMSDVEMLKVFMLSMKCIDKSVEYDYTHHWLNFGLLTSGGKLMPIKCLTNINNLPLR